MSKRVAVVAAMLFVVGPIGGISAFANQGGGGHDNPPACTKAHTDGGTPKDKNKNCKSETPPPPATPGHCAKGANDGLAGDTIARQAYDGGLSAVPVFADPHAKGPISSQIYGGADSAPAPLNGLGHEVACVVSLVDDNAA